MPSSYGRKPVRRTKSLSISSLPFRQGTRSSLAPPSINTAEALPFLSPASDSSEDGSSDVEAEEEVNQSQIYQSPKGYHSFGSDPFENRNQSSNPRSQISNPRSLLQVFHQRSTGLVYRSMQRRIKTSTSVQESSVSRPLRDHVKASSSSSLMSASRGISRSSSFSGTTLYSRGSSSSMSSSRGWIHNQLRLQTPEALQKAVSHLKITSPPKLSVQAQACPPRIQTPIRISPPSDAWIKIPGEEQSTWVRNDMNHSLDPISEASPLLSTHPI